jgi:hypothetical protein
MKMEMGLSGALSSSVTLTVGLDQWLRRILCQNPKTRKLGFEGHHQFECLEDQQKGTKASKEDGYMVTMCVESICDSYTRPGPLVVEQ